MSPVMMIMACGIVDFNVVREMYRLLNTCLYSVCLSMGRIWRSDRWIICVNVDRDNIIGVIVG
jgi:hypothetical protein